MCRGVRLQACPFVQPCHFDKIDNNTNNIHYWNNFKSNVLYLFLCKHPLCSIWLTGGSGLQVSVAVNVADGSRPKSLFLVMLEFSCDLGSDVQGVIKCNPPEAMGLTIYITKPIANLTQESKRQPISLELDSANYTASRLHRSRPKVGRRHSRNDKHYLEFCFDDVRASK